MNAKPQIFFAGRVVVLGCGSVSRCLQPLILQHFDMDFRKLTIVDFEDLAASVPDTLATGARYVRRRLTPENLSSELADLLGPGDLLINLSWNIDTRDIVEWCHDHHVLYIDTSVELWDPYAGQASSAPADRTLYARHMALRQHAARWNGTGATAVIEHGANPGLVSHWVKVALEDIAIAILRRPEHLPAPLSAEREKRLENLLSISDHPGMARETGTKVIHVSERDTQISRRPKEVGEFVNTWSVEGFYEEGIAPAELGWGTHERVLPPGACTHETGPRNQICLARTGASTWVRSWVPTYGPIQGMLIRHGESFTISDFLTVREGQTAVYRPTVHYAYLPTDAAIASWHECRMSGYSLQPRQRIMDDDIVSGIDELGVLLLGHDLTGWWTGSQLGIEEARRLVPHQNATTLQVAASVLGAVAWMLDHPDRGLCTPENLDHEAVLRVAGPYLGPCPSLRTDWTPLTSPGDPFMSLAPRPSAEDVWQFGSFLLP
jgi:homospermidine synthase